MTKKIYTAIGLMSGTSGDGIDLAMIQSDGKSIIKNKKFKYVAYDFKLRQRLKSLINERPTLMEIKSVERDFTILNAQIINEFLDESKISCCEIDVIAFHGHTIFHDSAQKLTWQIGDFDLLQAKTKIKVINNFRTFDVANGGQGAPLVPIYHCHMLQSQQKPIAVLNIGGITNITYIPSENEKDIEAFDIAFGNAPLDDLVKEKIGAEFDKNGEIAKSGEVDFVLADRILQNEIFHQKPPKSFDRNDFVKILAPINNLKIQDALATFSYMHARAIAINLGFLKNSQNLKTIFLCGGGRKNQDLVLRMRQELPAINIKSVEEINLNGDAIEAEAFAFLAIRMIEKLPISFQKTTGISPETDYAQVFSR